MIDAVRSGVARLANHGDWPLRWLWRLCPCDDCRARRLAVRFAARMAAPPAPEPIRGAQNGTPADTGRARGDFLTFTTGDTPALRLAGTWTLDTIDVPELRVVHEVAPEVLWQASDVTELLNAELRAAGFQFGPGAPPIERQDDVDGRIRYVQRKRAHRVPLHGGFTPGIT